MFGANGYYCSEYVNEIGIVPAKRWPCIESLHPTMALNFVRDCLTVILLSPYHFVRAIFCRLSIARPISGEKQRMPKFYDDDEAWADIEPLPQDDGGLHPLAAIAYSEEYSQAMGYLRAVMARNEFSERVMALTEHIISMNPAHYTVW
jgi:protein farnesyltransferase/geranylgeranyltransferase type-1 subunit alpha